MRGTRTAAGLLLAGAVACWWLTGRRMGGMAMGPTTELGSLGFYTSVWVVMMAAVMFPAVWPVVGVYDQIAPARRDTVVMVAGYLTVWTTCGVLAFAAVRLARDAFGDFLPWSGAGRWVAAGVVLGAAVYQLTPLKNVCLTRCRTPVMFVMENWRPGLFGAFRMGALHGAWCVGCCWALMAALFALGVMSVGWMIFVAALIAIEKLLPWKVIANRGVAVLLVALALAVALVPADVPGLTVPSSEPSGMRVDG